MPNKCMWGEEEGGVGGRVALWQPLQGPLFNEILAVRRVGSRCLNHVTACRFIISNVLGKVQQFKQDDHHARDDGVRQEQVGCRRLEPSLWVGRGNVVGKNTNPLVDGGERETEKDPAKSPSYVRDDVSNYSAHSCQHQRQHLSTSMDVEESSERSHPANERTSTDWLSHGS